MFFNQSIPYRRLSYYERVGCGNFIVENEGARKLQAGIALFRQERGHLYNVRFNPIITH